MGAGVTIDSTGVHLVGWISRPATGTLRPGLVLCHGFPLDARASRPPGHTFTQLADQLAADVGWTVLTFDFRGTGESGGAFSLGGWRADIGAAVDHLLATEAVTGAWLAGFSTGAALAVCATADDQRVRGVASLGAPADFHDWVADPQRLLERARSIGMGRAPEPAADLAAWGRDLRELRAVAVIGRIPPRPILIVHGSDDDVVPVVDARALADAAEGEVELRVLAGAGHRLRDDPRAVALLLGWLDRQGAA